VCCAWPGPEAVVSRAKPGSNGPGHVDEVGFFIPTSLPPGLYHQAGGGQEPFSPVKSHIISGHSGSFSPVVGSFQQHTGQIQLLQPNITGPSSQLKAL
jgi:hypothetical protein